MGAKANYEGRILGSIIQENNQIPDVRVVITPDEFQNNSYSKIYKEILELYSQNSTVDVVMLSENIDPQDEFALEEVMQNSSVSKQTVETYAKEVKRRSRIGRMEALAKTIANETKSISKVKVEDLITHTHTKLFEIAGDNTYERPTKEQVIEEMQEDMVRYSGKELWGFDTGFETLNTFTRGVQRQQLWVIGAFTSIGKSWYCLKLAHNLAKSGSKVLYLSTEMSEKRLMWRLATMVSGMSEYKLIYGNLDMEEHTKREETFKKLQTLPIQIRSGIADINECIFEIRKGKTQDYCDVVIVDFVQNLSTGKDEYQELSNAVRKLQNIAMREDVGVIAASQNNRESQRGDFEALLGFKGSGAIETCADVAIILSRDKEDPTKKMIIDIGKNRNGIVGRLGAEIDFATGSIKDTGELDG